MGSARSRAPAVLPMGIGCHVDTPRILRLSEEYMKENPQVRQVVGPTASERDMEGWDVVSDDDVDIEEDQ